MVNRKQSGNVRDASTLRSVTFWVVALLRCELPDELLSIPKEWRKKSLDDVPGIVLELQSHRLKRDEIKLVIDAEFGWNWEGNPTKPEAVDGIFEGTKLVRWLRDEKNRQDIIMAWINDEVDG